MSRVVHDRCRLLYAVRISLATFRQRVAAIEIGVSMRVNYRSTADLSRTVHGMGRELAGRYDVVAGVPRSGLLAASMLALQLDVPLTDVAGLLDNRLLASGSRVRYERKAYLASPRRVLVMDDSLATGGSLAKVREQLERSGTQHEVSTAAAYVRPSAEKLVDHVGELVHSPRLFQWNAVNHVLLKRSCVDLDGVLCADPRPGTDDDGPRYAEFLRSVTPLVRPHWSIGWIVTSRLEKYRPQTDEWLSQHGIEYAELIMLDHSSPESRRGSQIASAYKASVYRDVGAVMFIESSIKQAVEIAHLAQRDVFCTDMMEMVRFDQRPTAVISLPASNVGSRRGWLKDRAMQVLPKSVYTRIAKAGRRVLPS